MRFIISLSHDQWARLREVAATERRRPQDQAAVLLGGALGSAPLPVPAGEATPSTGSATPVQAPSPASQECVA